MFKTFKKIFFVGFYLHSFSVYSQDEKSLEELVVTANKSPQKQNQTGKVISVLSDSLLKANLGMNLGQILSQQVGVLVTGQSQTMGSVQNVSLRGANFGHTLILIDGVPVNEPSGIGSSFDINQIPIQQIERVEIMKNGQSSLYGSDAIGGVINIITKQKSKEKLNYTANIYTGNMKTAQATVGISGTFNKTSYSLNQTLITTDGFSSAIDKNASKVLENDGYKSSNTSFNISQEISKDLNLRGFYRYNVYKTDLDEGAFIDDKDYTYLSKNNQAGLGLTLKIKPGKITFNYLFNQTFRNFKNDSTNVPFNAFTSFSNTDYLSKASFGEVFANLRLSKVAELLIGMDYRAQNMSYEYFSVSAFGPYEDTPIKPENAKINNQSVYTSLNFNFENGLGMELGGRLNNHSTYGGNATYSLNPFYVINERLKIFTTMSTSFKNPALYQLYSPYGNLDLQPEFAKTVDLGWQYFGENPSNNFRIVYFNRAYSDLIFFSSLNEPPYGQYINLTSQKNDGIEIDGKYGIKNLSINANYTFLSGKISDDLILYEKSINTFLRRPNHNFNLNLGYNFSKKLKGSATFQYQSKRNDLYYDGDTFSNAAVILNDFAQIHTNWSYQINNKWGAFIQIQNLTNTSFTEVYGYSSRPFTFIGGLNFLK
ncbi:TonB-dependent siderophore receptor [Lacihabitans sp. LS3-19]|uniref:TonB-dependent receptor plug domain-containing protein n=1 Tax=Lacihabitans sp. LS3-19 TaxID=2487335 RepID=UPI0020CE2145|nr:TonB-dependent receptor [Lacihabitans sp. LS3-19]